MMGPSHIASIRESLLSQTSHQLTAFSPIDVFVTYDGKRAADITVSRYAVRQIVSAEVRIYVVKN